MPENKLQSLHLSMLEDFLPVGLAIYERAKEGGADKVLEGLIYSDHPIERLKGEGFSSAKLVREKLNKISPGLGNPVFEVTVKQNNQFTKEENLHNDSLLDTLQRIEDRLSLLKSCLDDTNI